MRMEIGLSQVQVQKQILSPQMIQSMEILVLNSQQLEERIDQALEENVALELEEPGESSESSLETGDREGGEFTGEGSADGGAALEGLDSSREMDLLQDRYEHLAEFQSEEYYNSPGRRGLSLDDSDDKYEALLNTAGNNATLQQHLEDQVRLRDLNDRQRALCSEVIYNLDSRGYLMYPIEEIHDALSRTARRPSIPVTLPNTDHGGSIHDGSIEDSSIEDGSTDDGSIDSTDDGSIEATSNGTQPNGTQPNGTQPNGTQPNEMYGSNAVGAANGRDANGVSTSGDSDSGASKNDSFDSSVAGSGVSETHRAQMSTDETATRVHPNGIAGSIAGDRSSAWRIPDGMVVEGGMLTVALPIGLDELQQALEHVRELDPSGVGATGLEDCLLLQLDRDPGEYPLERQIIAKHLQDVARNRLPQIAKSTGTTLEDVKDALDIIRSLNPHPGKAFSDADNSYIQPDVIIEEDSGEYKVRVDNGYTPRLRISPYYRELLAEARKDPEIRKYIKKKLDNAEWLLHAIHQRKSTLQRVAEEVVKHQQDFFLRGERYLKPLKMQEIADTIGVNVSTVSRAIAGKYFQAPGCIKDLKFLFTGGTQRDDGTMESRGAVILRIKELISDENTKRPLSDSKIVDLLSKEGIHISRRTVTKYREAEGIPSSRERRMF